MKKIFFFIFSVFMLYSLYHTAVLYFSGANLPQLTYKNYITNSSIPTKLPLKKTLILFFTTDCGSCEEFAKEILNFSKKNPDFNFVFITEEKDSSKINDYIDRSKIREISNFVFIDENRSFQKDFGLGFKMSIPTILFYDHDSKFVKEINNLEELWKI